MKLYWRSGQTWVACHSRSFQKQNLNSIALPDVVLPVHTSILTSGTCMTKELTISEAQTMNQKSDFKIYQTCREWQIPAGNSSNSWTGLSSHLLSIKYFAISDEVGSLCLLCLWEPFDLWWVLGQHQDPLSMQGAHMPGNPLLHLKEQESGSDGGFLHNFSKHNTIVLSD